MGTYAFLDATTWVGGLDETEFLRECALNLSVAELDSTVFGLGYRRRTGGLADVSATFAGWWEAGAGLIDPEEFTNLAVANRVVTMTPTGVETSVAYMWQGGNFGYQFFGPIGELAPFNLNYMGTDNVGCIRGQVAKAKGNVSATGQLGSILELTDVAADEFAYCTVHIFTAGTTVTLQLQSDADAGFASPTTQATIGPLTTTGGTWMTRVPGAIADTHWRLNVSAITGTFAIAAAIGIK